MSSLRRRCAAKLRDGRTCRRSEDSRTEVIRDASFEVHGPIFYATLVVLVVWAWSHPPDPRAHWGSRAYELDSVEGPMLATGFLVAAVGFLASRRRTLRILTFIAMCIDLWLAASSFLVFY